MELSSSSRFCGWVPEPLDTAPITPLQMSNRSADIRAQLPGHRDADYDPGHMFFTVLQSIDDTLRNPETAAGLPPGAGISSGQLGYNGSLPKQYPPLDQFRPLQASDLRQPPYSSQNRTINRGSTPNRQYDPVGSLLENLESALKASEVMLTRTQDLDIQAHAAIMQVKHLEDLLARKETQYACEINELHLLLRAERSERWNSSQLPKLGAQQWEQHSSDWEMQIHNLNQQLRDRALHANEGRTPMTTRPPPPHLHLQ